MDLFNRFVGIWLVFVFYIAVGVKGAVYDEACTADTDCTELNAEKCDIGTTDKCICSAGFFRKTTSEECSAQVDLNTNCEAAQTSSEQCSVANSECKDDGSGSNTLCLCKDTHHEAGGLCVLTVGLDGTCDSTDQCSVADTECRDDGTGSKCLCITTHFSDGTACKTKIAGLETACDDAVVDKNQCGFAETECRNDGAGSKCFCKATHYSDGTICQLRIALNTTCTVSAHCIANAECRDDGAGDQCYCKDTHNPDGSTCVPRLRSGVIKVTMLQYMYVVPIIVSMMFLLR